MTSAHRKGSLSDGWMIGGPAMRLWKWSGRVECRDVYGVFEGDFGVFC